MDVTAENLANAQTTRTAGRPALPPPGGRPAGRPAPAASPACSPARSAAAAGRAGERRRGRRDRRRPHAAAARLRPGQPGRRRAGLRDDAERQPGDRDDRPDRRLARLRGQRDRDADGQAVFTKTLDLLAMTMPIPAIAGMLNQWRRRADGLGVVGRRRRRPADEATQPDAGGGFGSMLSDASSATLEQTQDRRPRRSRRRSPPAQTHDVDLGGHRGRGSAASRCSSPSQVRNKAVEAYPRDLPHPGLTVAPVAPSSPGSRRAVTSPSRGGRARGRRPRSSCMFQMASAAELHDARDRARPGRRPARSPTRWTRRASPTSCRTAAPRSRVARPDVAAGARSRWPKATLLGGSKPGFELFDKQQLGATTSSRRSPTSARSRARSRTTIDQVDGVDGAQVQLDAARRTSSSPTNGKPATAAVLLGSGARPARPGAVRGHRPPGRLQRRRA